MIPLGDLPEPEPGRPHWNLLVETWSIHGPETGRSKRRRLSYPHGNMVPILGLPDPNPMPLLRWRCRDRVAR